MDRELALQLEVASPEWIAKELQNYRGPHPNATLGRTSFGRNHSAEKVLRKYVEKRKNASPDILYVGSGYDTAEWGCASGPFEIAGMHEGLGKRGYGMTVLDIEQRNLDLARSREKVYRRHVSDMHDSEGNQIDAFLQYAKDTRPRSLSKDAYDRDHLLVTDFVEAEIPRSFGKKRRSGEIEFEKGDIVTYQPGDKKFDLVHCCNVLVHMRRWQDVTLALYNIGQRLKRNGLALVDDIKYTNDYRSNLSLDPKSKTVETHVKENIVLYEKNMGLKIVKEVPVADYQTYMILRKV